MAKNCPAVDAWRALLVASEPERCQADLCRHLETCADCQHTMETLEEADELEEVARNLEQQTDPKSGLGKLMTRLKESGATLSPEAGTDTDLYFLRSANKPDLLGYLDGYEVHEEIHRGGMGIVLKAYDPAF